MASQKQLNLLATGSARWKKWRRAFPDVQAFEPDLHEADLHGVQLRGFNLRGADLTEVNLQEADLQWVVMRCRKHGLSRVFFYPTAFGINLKMRANSFFSNQSPGP